MKKISDEQATLRGEEIALMLGLKINELGRYNTTWGDKTPLGLFKTLSRVMFEQRDCWLKRDQREVISMKPKSRARFAQAWRIVDKNGDDLVQPWCNNRAEARALAKNLGYKIQGLNHG